MKKNPFIIILLLLINISMFSQKFEPVTVKAGRKVGDCFSFNERYRYPEFVNGRIWLNKGIYSDKMLNYDFLSGEVEYIRGKDTLAIANGADIRYIVAAGDTFYFNKGAYLEQIYGQAPKVALKQYIKLKETQKQDSYGTSGAGSAINSYGMLPSQGGFYKLVANEDMVFQRTIEYYLSDLTGGFAPFDRKNVLKIFSSDKDKIKEYLKSNKIDFDNRDDLIKLAGYLSGLIP